jgi:hypothetical protein
MYQPSQKPLIEMQYISFVGGNYPHKDNPSEMKHAQFRPCGRNPAFLLILSTSTLFKRLIRCCYHHGLFLHRFYRGRCGKLLTNS